MIGSDNYFDFTSRYRVLYSFNKINVRIFGFEDLAL